jgi:60 kDa SS-A/Ro ribonucleoprotein
MSSKKLFASKSRSASSKVVKPVDTRNHAGGVAYSMSDKAGLAQLAMTGCFNGTYYVSDQEQLATVTKLANKVETEFLAKLAIHARQEGKMKDMPAFLAALVANRDSNLLAQIFSRVIDSPKMVRNFVQILRSGTTGRKSLGTRPKKLVQQYLESLTDEQLFRADVGNDPSLEDLIKMVHPKPHNKARSALYGYLLDKEYSKRDLCKLVKEYETFKEELTGEIPNVPFQKLTALALTDKHWKQIAENASWTQTRMNLNTFQRHGVFKDTKMINLIADRLQDPELVEKSGVFPYQLYTAFSNVDSSLPTKIKSALQRAADLALVNVPEFDGKTYVMVDTSGSMESPVTGNRGSATTKTNCIDVAALIASAVLRKNPDAEIIPFDTQAHGHHLNPLDSIMTNARTLSSFGGGGTNCSIALQSVNQRQGKGDLVIYVSDNESWIDNHHRHATGTMVEWTKFKARNPQAKMVCIDLSPNTTTQAHDREDILNVGGFGDSIFEVIAIFNRLGNNKDLWVKSIEAVKL